MALIFAMQNHILYLVFNIQPRYIYNVDMYSGKYEPFEFFA